jgi:hypothetical protein
MRAPIQEPLVGHGALDPCNCAECEDKRRVSGELLDAKEAMSTEAPVLHDQEEWRGYRR